MKFKNISKLLAIGILLNNILFNSSASTLSEDTRYETFEGSSITINNILEKDKADIEIKGNTLVNILDYSIFSKLSNTPNSLGFSISGNNGKEITRDFSAISGHETNWISSDKILKKGAVYTYVVDIIKNTEVLDVELFPFAWKYCEWKKGSTYIKPGYTGKAIFSFKCKEDSEFSLLHENIDKDLTGTVSISNLMILQGDYYDEFTSDNSKIPDYFEGIKSTNENDSNITIISSNSITTNSSYIKGYGLISGNTSLYENADRHVLEYTKVKPNTCYTINHPKIPVLNFYDKDKNYLGYINEAKTFTTPENCYYIKASIDITYGTKIDIIESTENLKENKLTIDLQEPLRGLPNNVRDRIIKKNNQWYIERNVGSMILNSTSRIELELPGNGIKRFVIYNIESIPYFEYRNPVIANNFFTVPFTNTDSSSSGNEILTHDNGLIFTKYSNIYIYSHHETVEEFKEWLNDNPQTLYYQLKFPTYEKINIPCSIELYDNVTYVSNDAGIPANLKITIDRVLNRATDAIELVKINPTTENLTKARYWTNLLRESTLKDQLQNEISEIVNLDDLQIEKKSASSNSDIYIKSKNTLSISLDTNNIVFNDFTSTEDIEQLKALNITISSSLPYDLNAYMPTEIYNNDKSNSLNRLILNIKDNSESNYQNFANDTDKIILKGNCNAGTNLNHGIDFMLSGGLLEKADIYKTTIKFEAVQK